jgi:hypothetical protein
VHLNTPIPSEEVFPTREFQMICTFEDGRREASEPVERRHVREALARARAMPGVSEVAVHDVTRWPEPGGACTTPDGQQA